MGTHKKNFLWVVHYKMKDMSSGGLTIGKKGCFGLLPECIISGMVPRINKLHLAWSLEQGWPRFWLTKLVTSFIMLER